MTAKIPLSAVEAEILRRLDGCPRTGTELQQQIETDAVTYAAAAARLWNSSYLRGRTEDGCCNDPCGPLCVSAFEADCVWMLTAHGEAALQDLTARM